MIYELEIEGFENGIGYFSIKDRKDLGYFYLHGAVMNENKIVGRVRVTVEAIDEEV